MSRRTISAEAAGRGMATVMPARCVTPEPASAPLAELEAKFRASRTSPDALEVMSSFREKRKPNWYPVP